MIKVLIADDESRVRREIMSNFDCDSMEFQVVGEAEDGDGALEIARAQKPNLVLVGISIPVIREINLIEEFKRVLDNPIIIIISGHDQFNYDQIICKLNVFDYILKPINEDELKYKIQKAKKEFHRRNDEKSINKDDIYRWKNDDLKKVFLKDWIRGKINSNDIIREMNCFNIGYTKNMGIAVARIIEGNKMKKEMLEFKSEILINSIDIVAKELGKKFTNINVFQDTRNQIVIICDTMPIKEWYVIERILEDYIYESLGINVICCSSFLRENPIQINVVYKSICNRLSEAVKKNNIMIDIQKYIKRYYSKEDISIGEIASKFKVSQTFIVRMFKRELGTTFSEYLINQRIKSSITLMRDKKLDIDKISKLAGYESVQYFRNIFKKRVGISPDEYKLGLNNENNIS